MLKMNPAKPVLIFWVLFFLLTNTVYSDEKGTANKDAAPESEEKTEAYKPAPNEYRIGIGDVLEITTWKEPDLSLESGMVRSDGKLTFPLLDDLQAEGLTTMALKYVIEKGLSEYVEEPMVTVTLSSPLSQRFYILGEVAKTGEYQILKNLTVMQAFALAGGFTEWASKDEIILYRKENGTEKTIRINYKSIIKGDFSKDLVLKADDTIIVP